MNELTKKIDTGTSSLVLSGEHLQSMHQMAEMMASARVTVPKHLAGSPGDCLAIVMQATQWGMNPFAVAQKTHLVNGTLGYEAQLVNAVVTNSGAAGRFHYEYRGDGATLTCRVGAVLSGDSEITWGEWLSASDVQTKNSPLWKTNPRQQLGYLQVKNWARAYTPGAILGVYTEDEIQDQPIRKIEPADPVYAVMQVQEKIRANQRKYAEEHAPAPLPEPINMPKTKETMLVIRHKFTDGFICHAVADSLAKYGVEVGSVEILDERK